MANSHYFTKWWNPNIDPGWKFTPTADRFSFFTSFSNKPHSTDPTITVNGSVGINFDTEVPPPNAGKLPALTVKGGAVIGYDPRPMPPAPPYDFTFDIAVSKLANGLKVKGRIGSETDVITPICRIGPLPIKIPLNSQKGLPNLGFAYSDAALPPFTVNGKAAIGYDPHKIPNDTFFNKLEALVPMKNGLSVSGPIVQVRHLHQSWTHGEDQFIVMGEKTAASNGYGIRIQSETDAAGMRLQNVVKYAKKTKKKNGKKVSYWKAIGVAQDTIVHWGNESTDCLRIRFEGNVPKYLDFKKNAKGKKYGDEIADQLNKKNNRKGKPGTKRAGFENNISSAAGFRDIVVIEPDGSFKVNGSVYAYQHRVWSDARLKESVRPIRGALDKINAMRGVSYRWRFDEIEGAYFDDRRQLGLVAQEVEKVCPEIVSSQMHDKKETKAVDYTQLVPVLIEAMKEQQTLIEAQRERLESLERFVRGEAPAAPNPPQAKSKAPRPRKRSSKHYDA